VIGALEDVGLTVGADKQRITLWIMLQAVAALALTLALAAWISRITESRVLAAKDLEMSTRVVITKAVRVATLFLAILVALPLVGIPITALSVFSGALGVGLGFGLQKIASNYVSGFIVLLDRSLRIGDLITVDNRKGEVKAIETRFTVIKGSDGVESIIPNEKLITEIVNHHTYSDSRVTVVLPVVVAFESDMDAVLKLLLEAATGDKRVLPDPAPFARIKALRDHGVELELTVWIDDPGADGDVRSDLYRAILRGLREGGVEIARPRPDWRMIATPEMQNKYDESRG
jgi:small-conductance mechanosensitive channel